MTRGTRLLTDSWKMYAALDGEVNLSSCRILTDENLQTILNICGFSPEGAISIMQEGPTKLTITVTYCGQKKTPEKNGAL